MERPARLWLITQSGGADRGKDIFVHHTGIRPASSHYRTLFKGEYVQYRVLPTGKGGANSVQASHVTGVLGGPLMCDIVPARRCGPPAAAAPPCGPPPPARAISA